MRALIQKVKSASVSVDGKLVSEINKGLCVLIGIHKNDEKEDSNYIVKKLLNIRLFDDSEGKRWQKSIKDLGLQILCISQFTLYCDLKGNKPDYRHNMKGEEALLFYNEFLNDLKKEYDENKISGELKTKNMNKFNQ